MDYKSSHGFRAKGNLPFVFLSHCTNLATGAQLRFLSLKVVTVQLSDPNEKAMKHESNCNSKLFLHEIALDKLRNNHIL